MPLTAAALAGLKLIYRPDYAYQKAGVMLADLKPWVIHQPSLFGAPEALSRCRKLMATLDRINAEFGQDVIRLSTASIHSPGDAPGSAITATYRPLG